MKPLLSILVFSLFILWSCGNSTKEAGSQKQAASVVDTVKSTASANEDNSAVLTSKITCPKCGFSSEETMPTEVCQLAYTCKSCKTVLHPKDGDCCVFCTYGDNKCPSMQLPFR